LEDDRDHRRTVAVGDFNMNPFEPGLVATKAFHGVMTKRLAHTVNRLSRRADYPCFYNPMWQLFGDRTPQPPGTHFFMNTTDVTNQFWHIYDQVLLRPALMDKLQQLHILDSDGLESLVTKEGRPRRSMFSDHLPIYFQLDLS
jgi:endonuclease/exonuclease/phosphatase family metal-dependent hydrolase